MTLVIALVSFLLEFDEQLAFKGEQARLDRIRALEHDRCLELMIPNVGFDRARLECAAKHPRVKVLSLSRG